MISDSPHASGGIAGAGLVAVAVALDYAVPTSGRSRAGAPSAQEDT